LAFLVGVDFDLWIDVHLPDHRRFIVAASCANVTTGSGAGRKMKSSAMTGKLVVVCGRIFIVCAFALAAFGKVEASDADEYGDQVPSPANAKPAEDTSTRTSTALRPEEIQNISPKQRAYLLGDWFGLRPNLAAKGVVFSLISIGPFGLFHAQHCLRRFEFG
jgi:hypothetical protein